MGLLLSIPAVIDGGTQFFRWRSSNNRLRLITGTLLGVSEVILFTHIAIWATQAGYYIGTLVR